jgi:hypothetical protein
MPSTLVLALGREPERATHHTLHWPDGLVVSRAATMRQREGGPRTYVLDVSDEEGMAWEIVLGRRKATVKRTVRAKRP